MSGNGTAAMHGEEQCCTWCWNGEGTAAVRSEEPRVCSSGEEPRLCESIDRRQRWRRNGNYDMAAATRGRPEATVVDSIGGRRAEPRLHMVRVMRLRVGSSRGRAAAAHGERNGGYAWRRAGGSPWWRRWRRANCGGLLRT